MNPCKVIITTGFIASTPKNIPTTLKRDGSDFSAAITGSLLRAGQVTIWIDVDSVYSEDPRKVSDVVILKTLSYHEAWNIFNLSAPMTKICHPAVNDNGYMANLQNFVKEFATIDNLALVNVEGTGMALDNGRISQVAIIPNCSILAAVGQKLASPPGISATIFNALAKPSINVRAIAQGCSEYNITIVVKREEKAAYYRPKILICGESS
ncbi:unnamed protein product [Vicia faba]|uniref:aspartate kinase n=1 Tax=Vicia faba TaxID=3906 RepID=A0AAV1A735_VICFA|nr:unnamed protein product [Vicia faba]